MGFFRRFWRKKKKEEIKVNPARIHHLAAIDGGFAVFLIASGEEVKFGFRGDSFMEINEDGLTLYDQFDDDDNRLLRDFGELAERY